MKRIGIIVKFSNPETLKVAAGIVQWAGKRGATVYSEPDLAALVPGIQAVQKKELPDKIQMMIVLGGDGTMLSAARLINGRKVPILGVNLGGLGFLTAITKEEMYPLLERTLSGNAVIEERMMLSVTLKGKDGEGPEYKVLNDAVIKGTIARLVRLEMRINKEYVTTYRADGLIVSTPTGSTAYSLSASGPILYPTIHSIIVVPICPFNLTNRPVVIPDWMSVDMTISADQPDAMLILDGQVDVPLQSADEVRIKRADALVYLVKNETKSYFDILRDRLMWEVKTPERRV